MATYQQVLKSTTQGRRNIWYIHGSEISLVQDAYEFAQSHVRASGLVTTRRVFHGDAPLHEVLSALGTVEQGDRHLTVLLDAQEFTSWSTLLPYVKELTGKHFFIAVSTRGLSEEDKKVFIGANKARYVTCERMKPEDQLVWVKSRLGITNEAASLLVSKAQGDHYWLLNQLRKLECLNGTVPADVVKRLCPSRGTPALLDSILLPNKQAALRAIEHEDLSGLADVLVSRLTDIFAIRVGLEGMLSERELVERTGLSQKDISVYRKYRVYYDRPTTAKCYSVLTRLYERLFEKSPQAFYSLIMRW